MVIIFISGLEGGVMKIDRQKIINEAKNRMILYKGGKLPKRRYCEVDYEMDQKIIDFYNETSGGTKQ